MKIALKIPFMGILPVESPLTGLLKHYELIASGMTLIQHAVKAYAEGDNQNFIYLKEQVDQIEEEADRVKRNIRNHMPRGLFMPVDKTIFFTYTRSQDNILDSGQDGLNWLAMHNIKIPEEITPDLETYLQDAKESINALRPPLEATIELVNGGTADRNEIKQMCREVLRRHKIVNREQREIISKLYALDMPFKQTYQLLRFVEELHDMSHNTEGCADMLRAMIAK